MLMNSSSLNLQDSQLQELKEQVATLSFQNEQMQTTVTQQLAQIQQHKDQYNILKLKIGLFSAQPVVVSLKNRNVSRNSNFHPKA